MKTADLAPLLQSIYRQGPISRSDLVQQTGLSPGYMSRVIDLLKRDGLIQEVGYAASKGGRRKVLLQVNSESGHLLGIDLGIVNSRTIVTDFLGRVLQHEKTPSEMAKGEGHVVEKLIRKINTHIQTDSQIKGIGISLSGVIDSEAGKVLFWPRVQGWQNVPLKKIVEERQGLPVVVEDNSRAMAIAEQQFGAARGLQHFVYINLRTGVGGAIFTDGHLLKGRDGLAGEIGHTTFDEEGSLCSCGNRGCLDLYSSSSAIIRRVQMSMQTGAVTSLPGMNGVPTDLTLESIARAADCDDKLSQRVLSEAGLHLGTALAGITNLLNPEKIVLGGIVPSVARAHFMDPLLRSLRERAFKQSVKGIEVAVSQLGEDSAAVGVVLLVAQKVLVSLAPARVTSQRPAQTRMRTDTRQRQRAVG
jgi:predicted NBD/HSP70 family sugar kinase